MDFLRHVPQLKPLMGVVAMSYVNEVRDSLGKAQLEDGTITAIFVRNGKANVSFSTKQHTYMETR